MSRDIIIDALRMVWFKRYSSKRARLIFHSKGGSNYASLDFTDVLGTTPAAKRYLARSRWSGCFVALWAGTRETPEQCLTLATVDRTTPHI
jgi:hypothetical protein